MKNSVKKCRTTIPTIPTIIKDRPQDTDKYSLLLQTVIYLTKDTKQVNGEALVNLDWIKEHDVEVEFNACIDMVLWSNLQVKQQGVCIQLKDLNLEDTSPLFKEKRLTDDIIYLIKMAREAFETPVFITGQGIKLQFETQVEITR